MIYRDYIVSEQFIHDDLLVRAQRVAKKVPELWHDDQKIAPILLAWAGERIHTEDGGIVDDLCVFPLHNIPRTDWNKRTKELAALTKAVGLLLVKQDEDVVRVGFETGRGSTEWVFPIRRHGEVRILADPVQTTDGEVLGLLWRPKQKVRS